VKLSYKNPLFPQIFNDFHIYQNISSLFNKIPTVLHWLKTKIKYLPTFWVENKNFSQNFVFAFDKFVFCYLDPDPGSGCGKISRIRIRKKQIWMYSKTHLRIRETLPLSGMMGGGIQVNATPYKLRGPKFLIHSGICMHSLFAMVKLI